MRFKYLAVFSLVITVILIACNRNAVSLVYTNAKGEVPVLNNLVFRFNQSMVNDSLLNQWDSTDYVSFSPQIKGRFRWAGPDELIFSPAAPLSPATTYKATVNDEVLRHTTYNQLKDVKDISFHTPSLSLQNSQIVWIGESPTSAVPQIDLFFNYAVNPEDLKGKVNINVDGQKVDYTIITAAPDAKISVRVQGIKPEDKDYETKITVEKGIKPVEGNNSTNDAIVSSMLISSPYVLSIQQLESTFDGAEGVVKITTSQQLTGEALKPLISFSPAVNFSVENNEYGFTIRSADFSNEKSYTLTLAKGLRGKLGGVLKEEYKGSVAFGELEAAINFTNNKAVYLSKKGGQNIEVKITSVEKVKLVISKIYENNLLMSERYGYYPQESQQANNYDDYYDDYYGSNASLGDVIYEKEIDVRSLPKSAGGRLLNVSQFEDRLPEFKGIYHVMIRSVNDYWVRDSRFISLSDIGLIAKEGTDKMLVFANSIKTAQPVNGVTINVYGNNNQLVGTGSTDGMGVAEISYSASLPKGFKPGMIIAKTADDFNYLPLSKTRVNTSRFEVGGKRNNAAGLDAFVYAERDIYRPGEQVNFSVVVRDREWNSPGEVPMKLKFLMPNGKELRAFRKTLNEEGALEGNVPLSTAAITGTYTLEVYTATDVLLTTSQFAVEEFVPDRIKVQTKLSKPFLKPGESASLSVQATNFFGPPAANRNYETEIQVRKKNFSPAKFSNYDFNLTNQNSFFDNVVKEGKTDENGAASEVYQVPTHYANMGVLQTNFYTTVFDETGRPVSRVSSADIYTQNVFYGVKKDWFYYFPLNQPAKFELVGVNKDGDAVSSTAKIEVVKNEYRTVLTRSGSYFRYESQREVRIMETKEITVANNTAYSYVPRSPGDYEVRIYVPGSNNYISRSFYSYGSWGSDYSSFEVNTEGSIDISLDKKSYFTGDKVKALFKTPFDGKMLVTVETDKVISHQYVEVSKRTASLDLTLSGSHVPNAYITATLIKPHEQSDMPLTVANGFQNVKVEEKSRKIGVQILANDKVRSKTSQKVKVKAAPGSYVTLSAVDNGVLQITDFKTPDPYNYFYQKRALQVTGYNIYPLLFAEVKASMSSTGGDGELSMDKRVNPMPNRRVNVVSYWSGMKKANSSGIAEFDFAIPQFSGELRLMAVSYKGNSFGAGDTTMTVADPIVISTALPRFLSPGDTVTVPVTLTNTTAKAGNIAATIETEGALNIYGNNKQSLSINGGAEGSAQFMLVAGETIGTGKVKIKVNGLGESFEDMTEMTVRPPSTLQKLTGSGVVKGGTTGAIAIGQSDFIASSVDYKLVVSRSPVLELGDHLQYLVQYPYGCTEQTISAAFPQLYYGDLSDLIGYGEKQKTNANTNVIEAIRKIKMRQLYNGALLMWDGYGNENWWTTAYGAHFLIEARKAGFDVEESLLNTMLNYLTNRLRNKETINYYYNRDQQKKIAPKEVTYSLYVLALANRSNISSMNYYKANPSLLALDSRYVLAAAYALAGDKKSFAALLPSSFSGEVSLPVTGGSFYSPVRDQALALNTLIEADPGNAQVPVMIRNLAQQLKTQKWLSTQERVFAMLALGKMAKKDAAGNVTADIKVDGKTVGTVKNGSWKGDRQLLKGTKVEVVAKGEGNLYYFWEAEGISKSGAYEETDNYLKVRKRFYTRNGQLIDGMNFKQNDLIIVGITLEKSFSGIIENVVITDLLPAGFEIENPRTKEIPGMNWITDAATPGALDVRDDRIHFFVDAYSNKQVYYYAVRAVSPGRYKMGPVSADAMYNGEYRSYNGAGVITISR